MDHASSRTPPAPGTLPFVDGAFGEQIAELRREIEGIEELNALYRYRKNHQHQDQAAYERRRVRLEEILRQLAVLRPR